MTQSGSLASSIDLQVMSPTPGTVVEQLNASAASVNQVATDSASFVPMGEPIASREAKRALPYHGSSTPLSSRSSGSPATTPQGTPIPPLQEGMEVDNTRGSPLN